MKRIAVFVAAPVLLLIIIALILPEGDINRNPRSYFQSEAEYISFMKDEVTFTGITLNFVNIKPGDNFWKLARDYNVNIDTLIGINLFWNDLMAREGRTVIIPSEQGVIEFVNDKSEIGNLMQIYDVDKDSIVIQNRSFYNIILSLTGNERKPLAVFIKDVRPKTDNMNASLAGKFRVREMFRSPLGGRYSSFFGNRKHPVYRSTRFHNGVDIAAPYGTYIGASRDGVVVSTGWMGAYGKAVIIEHDNGYKTLYGHMSVIMAKPGQCVKAGKVIGKVGSTGLSTGPHLHFTMWHNGRLLNPMDILW